MSFVPLRCPQCGATNSLERNPGKPANERRCSYCGAISVLAADGRTATLVTGQWRCPTCGADNPAGNNNCEECSAVLTTVCPRCHRQARIGVNHCGHCGLDLVLDREWRNHIAKWGELGQRMLKLVAEQERVEEPFREALRAQDAAATRTFTWLNSLMGLFAFGVLGGGGLAAFFYFGLRPLVPWGGTWLFILPGVSLLLLLATWGTAEIADRHFARQRQPSRTALLSPEAQARSAALERDMVDLAAQMQTVATSLDSRSAALGILLGAGVKQPLNWRGRAEMDYPELCSLPPSIRYLRGQATTPEQQEEPPCSPTPTSPEA